MTIIMTIIRRIKIKTITIRMLRTTKTDTLINKTKRAMATKRAQCTNPYTTIEIKIQILMMLDRMSRQMSWKITGRKPPMTRVNKSKISLMGRIRIHSLNNKSLKVAKTKESRLKRLRMRLKLIPLRLE